VKKGIQIVLLPRIGRKAANKAFAKNSSWSEDARVLNLMRFDPVRICQKCNAVDVCDKASKPGSYFSLSPDEINDVRLAAGNNDLLGMAYR